MEKNNSKFFNGECNKCDKYGHRASYCWENRNKNDNRNGNKTAINTCFNGEQKKCLRRCHNSIDCWANKVK